MLQWFNKHKTSTSLSKDQQTNQQHSSSSFDLKDEDYEFLFNQLLDGVAHGWHKDRILKFFHDLEPRSNDREWISWIEKLETKVVYSNDPSQRRIGAILVRLAELTQSNTELQKFGRIAKRIGRKLLVSNDRNIIWEYDGQDLISEIAIAKPESVEDIVEPLATTTENQTEQILGNDSAQTIEFVDRETSEITIEESRNSSESESLVDSREQPTKTTNFVAETEHLNKTEVSENIDNNSLESTEVSPEELTLLKDNDTFQNKFPSESAKDNELITQKPDFILESVSQQEAKNSEFVKPKATTDELTVLQTKSSELDTLPDESNLELDSFAAKNKKNMSSTPVSVASFLEATKALIPRNSNHNLTSLSWEEFISVLEQDPALAQQVALHLELSSSKPDDIVRAAIDRIVQQEDAFQLPAATVELIKSWFELGLKQVSAEDFKGAIASWDKALELNPNLSEAWHNRGSALGRLEKYEEAIQSFNRAIKIAPERYQAWNDRAHALYQIQKWQQAVESWDKAISIMSDNYQFWYNRGCALEQLQRYDESISSYEKTLEIKPDFQPARSRYISLVTERSSSASN